MFEDPGSKNQDMICNKLAFGTGILEHTIYGRFQNIRGPNTDPKCEGSLYKDTHKQGPPIVAT